MTNRETLSKLRKLADLDADAVTLYEQALQKIGDPSVHDKLEEFREDHKRHAHELRSMLNDDTHELPNYGGPSSVLSASHPALRSTHTMEGSLRVLKVAESVVKDAYTEALWADLPRQIRWTIERGYEDAQRRWRYVTQALQLRVWEPLIGRT